MILLTALTKTQALLHLFFFISLFHIHISHSMEKPERVRQRWYNRSAVTGAGRGGAGGEGTDGLAAYLHSARTLKTQKTKQTVNYPCFLCISVQRRGGGAGGQRRETRLEEEQREGDAKGSTPNPLVLYIEILVYTAFLSLRRNLFDGTGGLCGPRCWCWWGARISQEGPSGGLAPAGLRGGRPEGGWGGGSRGGAGVPLGLSIGGQKFL